MRPNWHYCAFALMNAFLVMLIHIRPGVVKQEYLGRSQGACSCGTKTWGYLGIATAASAAGGSSCPTPHLEGGTQQEEYPSERGLSFKKTENH